jgi:hypothetical protein
MHALIAGPRGAMDTHTWHRDREPGIDARIRGLNPGCRSTWCHGYAHLASRSRASESMCVSVAWPWEIDFRSTDSANPFDVAQGPFDFAHGLRLRRSELSMAPDPGAPQHRSRNGRPQAKTVVGGEVLALGVGWS